MSASLGWVASQLLRREAEDADPDEPNSGQKEVTTAMALFILITLLIAALFTGYILQTRKIQAVHETVISIFAGMAVGLFLRLTANQSILGVVSFDYQFFFNLLLPPIILASGYELHQANFFRHIGPILTFAFAGTLISAVVLGIILWAWALLPFQSLTLSFAEALSVGATLSATDPVTVLAIFTTYKVDPSLYTVIFGESILNDAVSIVLFDTTLKYTGSFDDKEPEALSLLSLFQSIGSFFLNFFGSLFIGIVIGVGASLFLKFTHVRRFPKTESCLILLVAYASYFFPQGIGMSGIVALLFCAICMKHYAYHNMSRRTQLTTKFVFQLMAQLTENFIFIYLGLSLFTDTELNYDPVIILIATTGICAARWCAVFPLSKAINMVIRYRARRQGRETAEELPMQHQIMLFWAGLRGAVGVALAAGLTGPNKNVLRATVLVVVVLTVIIFGGTMASMLEILGIRTGVVEEIDSDDEFDIEVVAGGSYSRQAGKGFGHTPRRSDGNGYGLGEFRRGQGEESSSWRGNTVYNSATPAGQPPNRPNIASRRSSSRHQNVDIVEQGLLLSGDEEQEEGNDLDLPPTARRGNSRQRPPPSPSRRAVGTDPMAASSESHSPPAIGLSTATGAISQLFSGLSEDPAQTFRQIDEGFIKPHLLLDPGRGSDHHGGGSGGSSNAGT